MRAERSNVPREARYFTERGYRQYDLIGPGILDDLSAKRVWFFCSYLFWSQLGRNRENESQLDIIEHEKM